MLATLGANVRVYETMMVLAYINLSIIAEVNNALAGNVV
jgi:hypothetical protein